MNIRELENLKKREKELLTKLSRIKKDEKKEIHELKTEVEQVNNELKEITKKIEILEKIPEGKSKNYIKEFWAFLKKDTWNSWVVSLILIVILIKFIFFPTLALLTGSPLPLVVVESCSMYHESSFESWWDQNSLWYESNDISEEDFKSYSFKNGLNKGDILLIWGYSDYKIGDIIVFSAPTKYPLIHRIISKSPISTKGDHNTAQLEVEKEIQESAILGKSVIKIPIIGWAKLIFFEPFRQPQERGLCR